jgi:DNA-binding XRE family transcriptional regulator
MMFGNSILKVIPKLLHLEINIPFSKIRKLKNMNPKIQDGIKMRQHRELLNLSQADASKILSISQGEYCKIENEEHGISLPNLISLAEAFKTDVNNLVKTENGITINNSSFHDDSMVTKLIIV